MQPAPPVPAFPEVEYVGTAEAARRLDCHPDRVVDLIAQGILPAYRLPGKRGHYRIRVLDLPTVLVPVQPVGEETPPPRVRTQRRREREHREAMDFLQQQGVADGDQR